MHTTFPSSILPPCFRFHSAVLPQLGLPPYLRLSPPGGGGLGRVILPLLRENGTAVTDDKRFEPVTYLGSLVPVFHPQYDTLLAGCFKLGAFEVTPYTHQESKNH
jgi:hypothetical protein